MTLRFLGPLRRRSCFLLPPSDLRRIVRLTLFGFSPCPLFAVFDLSGMCGLALGETVRHLALVFEIARRLAGTVGAAPIRIRLTIDALPVAHITLDPTGLGIDRPRLAQHLHMAAARLVQTVRNQEPAMAFGIGDLLLVVGPTARFCRPGTQIQGSGEQGIAFLFGDGPSAGRGRQRLRRKIEGKQQGQQQQCTPSEMPGRSGHAPTITTFSLLWRADRPDREALQ